MTAEQETALEMAKGVPVGASALERVSRATSTDAAHWAFVQWDLRRRAKAKFANADTMLFVREALEQATHERVAAYHASLFPAGQLVADLTVGIGADLMALAARGPATGYELDRERAEYARHNLSVNSRQAEVRVCDSVAAIRNEAFPYAFADPARRVEGRRTRDIEEFEPHPRVLSELFQKTRLAVMKLSPMLPDEMLASLGSRVEFISFDDECREALIFAGADAGEGVWAVHVESGERLASSTLPASIQATKAYLFDADPAAIRAHGLGTLCERYRLHPLGDSNGYLVGDELISSPWLRAYRVLHDGKADLRTTRAVLRDLNADTPELKQRGPGLDLVKERKRYAMDGKREMSLAIWPIGRSLRHTILERV